MTKPAHGVSDKVRLKQVSSATDTCTSYKNEILRAENIYDTFEKANKKGADVSAGMHRLVCAFVVSTP